MTKLSYSWAVHVLGRCPMVNPVAGCQPHARVTPLLRFGLPSLPSVVRMVLASKGALGKHPFCVARVRVALVVLCGGCGVGVGVWGCGPLVVPCVCAMFVGGGGCAWVGCPRGGFSTGPGRRMLGWRRCLRSAAVPVVCCSALLRCAVCCAVLPLYVRAPLVSTALCFSSVHLR